MTASPIAEMAPTPITRILAVCAGEPDQDRPVLSLAMALANAEDVPLAALGAVDMPTDLRALARVMDSPPEQVAARVKDDLHARLAQTCAALAPDREITPKARIGKAFLEVIREVHESGAGLLIKRAEPGPGGHGPLFASTDQHLLRKCPCPVWLLRGADPAPPRGLLAAVDVDAFTAEQPSTQAALNLRIVECAARLAAFAQADVTLMHVWDAPGEGLLWRWSSDRDNVDHYLTQARAEHQTALDSFRAQARAHLDRCGLDTVKLGALLRRGAVREMVPAEIRAQGFDTLVMGTIARTGIAGFIIGNTAEDVLNSVDCSVVTVKPPGYVSPVR